MKTIVNMLFCLLLGFFTHAQSYLSDEFIVEYVADATDADKQAVRDLYNITDYEGIGPNYEYWYNIPLPMTITDATGNIYLQNIEALMSDIQGTETDARADVQEGDYNYIIELDDMDDSFTAAVFDPLPYCSDEYNDLLIGPAPENIIPLEGEIFEEGNGHIPVILIVDQLITVEQENVIVLNGTDNLNFDWYNPDNPAPQIADFPQGGNHGNKIFSVIQNQLLQAGIDYAQYINFVIFDDQGRSTYSRLLYLVSYLGSEVFNRNLDPWNTGYYRYNQNLIVNFSANIIASGTEEEMIIWKAWNLALEQKNMLLISSAGNQGQHNLDVYPAAGNWSHEMSVVGTENCFSNIWAHSNVNPVDFDIATEAKEVLTHVNGGYQLCSGTSYATAFVTGAAAQLAARCQRFNAVDIKNRLLEQSDKTPSLSSYVRDGNLLNVTKALTDYRECEEVSVPGGGSNAGWGDRSVYPNPFSETSKVDIRLTADADVSLFLYNAVGQAVGQQFFPGGQQGDVLQWETPRALLPGIYMLKIQAGEVFSQEILIKQ